MKIAYVICGNFDKEGGVEKKIFNQIKQWEKEGHQVKLFCFTRRNVASLFNSLDIEIIKYKTYIDLVINPFLTRKIFKWRPDIVYFRQYRFTCSFYVMFRKIPTVIEYNSDDVEESKLTTSFLIRLFHLLTRDIMNYSAAGYVTVTYELEEKLRKYNKPIITIANGISENTLRVKRKTEENKINAFFIGTPNQPWHGVDKIYYLASKLPDVEFHLVGIEDNIELDNVHTYGYLNIEEYIRIVEICDVAIGSLALHRNKMNEASPLKVREYLHFGLPVIIGYEDTDFIGIEHNFILKIPNDEDNVKNNLEVIYDFMRKSKSLTVSKEKIEHIYFSKKEAKRLKFISECLSN
jgi:glycosyltransferase involved in cell wall biosynthesis